MATAKKSGKKTTTTKKVGRPAIEEPSYLCPYCNTVKKRSEYYVSTDPLVKTGVTSMCKECAKKLSPWFSDRRSSTVEQIQEQLAYREDLRC